MKIECEVEEDDVPNERGGTQSGVKATCGECGHVERSFGTGEKSVKRCLILLKENCPRNETNYYVGEL